MSYMILGGCGFIGRNFVHYLANQDSCTKLVVCDKSRPELSWLTPEQKEAFANPKVVYKQINLSNQSTVSAFFSQHPCDYVINVAAETRLRMAFEVYEQHIYRLGMTVAEEAVKMGAKKFVQVTSARISILASTKVREDSMTFILKNQQRLEEDLKNIQGLNYTVIRPALVYGSGDKFSITPILILMSIYKKTGEELKLLGNDNLKIRTVHVEDVIQACLHVMDRSASGETFELVDDSNSTQGSIAQLGSEMFCVKYKCLGKLQSLVAQSFIQDVVEEINQKHMVSWHDVCLEEYITNTPLNPYLTEEQLMIDDYDVNNSSLKGTGFTFKHPILTKGELRKFVDEYVSQSLFPKSLAPS